MDQDHLGLFSLFLKNAYDETIHIDVVKVKRQKMLKRLDALQEACKEKEYEKANFLIFDVCDKVLNDPFSDEYELKPVEVDMIIFASSVLNISTKHYDRIKQIIKGLIMKYHNPIFYYVLGISYFYDLNFQEAKKHLIFVMRLLSDHKNTTFSWPDTDVMISTIYTDQIKEYALLFLNIIPTIEKVKRSTRTRNSRKRTSVEIIDISRKPEMSSTKLNMSIGNCIQHDVYPSVRIILNDLFKFDKSRLPVDYQKAISNVSEPVNNGEIKKKPNTSATTSTDNNEVKKNTNTQNGAKQKSATSEPATTEKIAKKSQATQNEAKQKCTTSQAAPEKIVTKKNEGIQTQIVQTKCKQVQAVVKGVSISIQTLEDTTELAGNHKLITGQQETINDLKCKIQQMTQKQKDIEAKLKNKTQKDNQDLDNKNRLIMEQQELIADLKIKLKESTAKNKELEMKINKMNSKVSELTRANKSILSESNKHKETIAELRNYNQLIETKAKYMGKKQEDIKSIHKILVERYKNSYFVQIEFYENFKTRCASVLSVLNNISEYLTEITVPSKDECELAIREWFAAMVSCSDILQSSKTFYKKFDKVISEDSLNELLEIPPIMPIREPTDVILENIPILIYTIRDFEVMLQNNNKLPKNIEKDGKKGFSKSKSDFNGKNDYRKKCNFIHKSDQSSTSDVTKNSYPSYEKAKSNEACSDSKNRAHFLNVDTLPKQIDNGGKKLRSLISYLKQNIPDKSEADIVDALNLFRQSNNGTLSGMTLQSILYNVLAILDSPETAWSAIKSNCDDLNNEELCPICIEAIHTKPKTVLKCRHMYHTECIREWLSVNRVCAVCRMFTVLDEDFPPLG